MRMINQVMERNKKSVRVAKEAPQYMIANDAPGNLVAALLPSDADMQLVNDLSPTINDLGKDLLQAAHDGDVDEIRRLMAKGAPFISDWLGTSPLHFAALNNHIEICEIFLRAGICKDTKTKVERTPLHMAVYEGNFLVVECLLKYGADVDAKDMLHMTPLHWAAQNGFADIAAILIRYGASTHVTNKFDLTPLDIAVQTNRADVVDVINFTIRDPLSSTQQALLDLNEHSTAVEPILQLSLQAAEGNAQHDSPPEIPIETVLMEQEEEEEEYAHGEGPSQEMIDAEALQCDQHATFTESMKLLQQHGITMLPDDESGTILSTVMETGHSVVLTEAGKQALNSIKAEKAPVKVMSETTLVPRAKTTAVGSQPAFKRKKIITVTADQFLAMTANSVNPLRIVNGKLVPTKPPPSKRIIPKHKASPTATTTAQLTSHEVDLTEQLRKARALAEAYKRRLLKTEQELQKYKQKCKLLLDQHNLNI